MLFTDDSRFNLSVFDGRVRVWRSTVERYQACNIVQHDWLGGSVMVWGGISSMDLHVLNHVNLTCEKYGDEILRPIVMPYAGAVSPGFLLVHDNARPHVARVCQRFLKDGGIDTIGWPARSPGQNPIEHLWDIMDQRIRWLPNPHWTVQELNNALLFFTLYVSHHSFGANKTTQYDIWLRLSLNIYKSSKLMPFVSWIP